jgi:hypothetical protein
MAHKLETAEKFPARSNENIVHGLFSFNKFSFCKKHRHIIPNSNTYFIFCKIRAKRSGISGIFFFVFLCSQDDTQ